MGGMTQRAIAAMLALAGLCAPALADEASARAFMADYLKDGLENTNAAVAMVDLNGDGAEEALVYVMGSYWCGSGGCNAYVLTPQGSSWAIKMETSVTQPPLGVLDSESHGWKDIFVSVGGGGMAGGRVVLRYDGETYPGNPSVDGVASGKAKGQVLIDAEARGEPLL